MKRLEWRPHQTHYCTEGIKGDGNGERVSQSPTDYGVWRSSQHTRGLVQGKTPAKNEFWCILIFRNAFWCIAIWYFLTLKPHKCDYSNKPVHFKFGCFEQRKTPSYDHEFCCAPFTITWNRNRKERFKRPWSQDSFLALTTAWMLTETEPTKHRRKSTSYNRDYLQVFS